VALASSVGFATIEQCPIDGAETDWTYDGGLTWAGDLPSLPLSQTELLSFGGCDAHSPQFVSPSYAFAVGKCPGYADPAQVSFLLSTSDAGSTWVVGVTKARCNSSIREVGLWAGIYRTTMAGQLGWVQKVLGRPTQFRQTI
jgi:hypothetical protein